METTVKIKRTKAYKVVLSTGDPVQIEQEEIQKLIDNAHVKGVIVFKRGIVNPSFIVSVVEDKDRMEAWVRECKANAEISDGYTQGDRARERGVKALDSIFEGSLREQLRAGGIAAAKQLGMEVEEKKLLG